MQALDVIYLLEGSVNPNPNVDKDYISFVNCNICNMLLFFPLQCFSQLYDSNLRNSPLLDRQHTSSILSTLVVLCIVF